jgi:outer membrane protein OmpA-like peptidoglycan-associated protein
MNRLSIALLGTAVALAACETVPQSNPALEDARSAVSAAAADPAVTTAAPNELQRARASLVAAESAWKAHDETDTNSLAYIAKQRANVAQEVAARYTTEQRLKQLGAERERIYADARTRDARIAQSQAAEANQQAAAATQQAATATQQAQSAQALAAAERQRSEDRARELDAEREKTARMQQDLQALAAKSTERGVVVTLPDVLFDTGRAELQGGGVHALQTVASVLNNHPERRVMVEGFTDSQGSDEYNRELAGRRADAVKDELQSLGVPNQNIQTHAYGKAYPVADNSTAAGRQQNRRVEIVFSDAEGRFKSR